MNSAANDKNVPKNEIARTTRTVRWSTPPASSNAARPSLSLVSRSRSRQKPIASSWVGLIR